MLLSAAGTLGRSDVALEDPPEIALIFEGSDHVPFDGTIDGDGFFPRQRLSHLLFRQHVVVYFCCG